MNLREASIYVRRKTARRLWWIGKIRGMVADAVADELLTEALEAKYPQLIDAEKAVKSAEQDFIKSFPNCENIDLE